MTARQPDLVDDSPRASAGSWRGVLSALRCRPRAEGARRRSRVHTLRKDELMRVEPRHVPGAIACRRGTCWVTQAGDPQDHVLLAGDRFRPATRGRVVVWAFTDAELEL